MNIPKTKELFSFEHTRAVELLEKTEYAWQVLPNIGEFISELGKKLPADEFYSPKDGVWIANDAKVFDSAYIGAPCIIDHGAEVRHCAFIRGSALVGKNAVVGNSTELKNVILFDNVQVPHYNYVGDSILGFKAHLGAGSITSNVKSDKTLVTIKCGKEEIETGIKKIGAIVGDHVEVGCGSVLCPGTVIGKNTNVYPLSMVRGTLPPNSIYKRLGEIAEKH